ncbi:hypothetical protein SJI00_21240 [Pseudomonas sp. RP23018S]|uniref:hypothetical protein n=1 Tax=Pseudomonas sp. RP23018S TaxID=3096037 RepID=UPI002ACAEC68|nr:hypothetical protein [Pseudomonas sp. RP23018S]MDZ5605303.1 hypothetical protein [Pseudomonas sp. RP23018S]
MRPATVSESEIISAGVTLQKLGKRVSGNSLRTVIGAGNPKRLMRIWSEAIDQGERDATHEDGESAKGSGCVMSPSQSSSKSMWPTPGAELANLSDQLIALKSQLHGLEHENRLLHAQLQQSTLIANAVNDGLTESKIRCAQLEAKEAQLEKRIGELHARVDEQRGELHRSSQARIALQKSIDALTALSVES